MECAFDALRQRGDRSIDRTKSIEVFTSRLARIAAMAVSKL